MERLHDIEGDFYLFPTSEGGRLTPAVTGYRPHHKLHDNLLTSGQHDYVNVNEAKPGDTVKTNIRLISPEFCPDSLWVGREIEVAEGKRQVGVLVVTRVLNETLLVAPELYRPVWEAPTGLDTAGRKIDG